MSHSRRGVLSWGSSLLTALASGCVKIGRSTPHSSLDSSSALSLSDIIRLQETFEHGLASGDPLPDRVIIWTRIGQGKGKPIPVRWEVSLDPSFKTIVVDGELEAKADADYTVKVDVPLPSAGTTYYYRFHARQIWSMVGRTRTASNQAEQARIAVVSCSSIWSGYFNAYELIANRNDLDLVIHCGDYIYEVPDSDEMRNMPFAELDRMKPRNLEEVRRRYAYNRKDPFLRRAHQQHPWSIIWDNHDLTDMAAPIADSVRAFHEWTPTRTPHPANLNIIYRRLSWGKLLDIILIDGRHFRSAEPNPSMLGQTQFEWLSKEMKQAKGRWKIIANQVMLSPFTLAGKVLSKNQWDGFPEERERLLGILKDNNIENTIVVTGDSHMSFACNLEHDGQPVGVEFLPSSVTRGNLDETVAKALSGIASGAFERLVKMSNSTIQYFDSRQHGYGILDLENAGARLEFWYVDHEMQTLSESLGASFYLPAGSQKLNQEQHQTSSPARPYALPAPKEPKYFIRSNEAGSLGGEYFDASERIPLGVKLRSVVLYSKDILIGIKATYSNALVLTYGQTSPLDQSVFLELGADEYFNRFTLGLDKVRGNIAVNTCLLETNLGRKISAGRTENLELNFDAAEGQCINGFYGRHGQRIDKIGVIYSPL